MEFLEISSFLGGLVSFIALIVFFVIAADISAIKKHLRNPDAQALVQYRAYLEKDDLDNAYLALLIVFYTAMYKSQYNRKRTYAELQNAYDAHFKNLGKKFPAYPF